MINPSVVGPQMAKPQVAEKEKFRPFAYMTASGGTASGKKYIYKSRKWQKVKKYV